MLQFSKYIGDDFTLTIPLELDGEPLAPGSDYTLIFTAKRSVADSDSEAVFQKSSTAGITVSGTNAIVTVVPNDTTALANCSLIIGIKAQNIATEVIKTVSQDRLILSLPVTRENETSVPVITTSTPLPFARTSAEIAAATAKTTPVNADKFGIWDSVSELLRSVTWANIKATLKTYFDTLYPPIANFSGASSGTNTGDQDLSGYAPLVSPSFTTPNLGEATASTMILGTSSLGGGAVIYTGTGEFDYTQLTTLATETRAVNFPDAAGTLALTSDITTGSDPTGITGADQITNIVSLTAAEYAAIGSPNASTLYVVI